jgi:flagellar operon protein
VNNQIHGYYHSVIPKHIQKNNQTPTQEFSKALEQQTLTISKHAKQRMESRNIHISESRWAEMEAKLTEAKQKGLKESLVILDNAAFIVNANNGTIITAMDRAESKTKIFTNLTGTIVMD